MYFQPVFERIFHQQQAGKNRPLEASQLPYAMLRAQTPTDAQTHILTLFAGHILFQRRNFSGTIPVTGGTGLYVGAVGEETIRMDSNEEPATGTAVMKLSI